MELYDPSDETYTNETVAHPATGAFLAVPRDPDLWDPYGVRTVTIGTALWGVAVVAMLPFYSWLNETGRLWWLLTCVAGMGLGLLGLEYCRHRQRRGSATATASATYEGDFPASPLAPPAVPRPPGGRRRR